MKQRINLLLLIFACVVLSLLTAVAGWMVYIRRQQELQRVQELHQVQQLQQNASKMRLTENEYPVQIADGLMTSKEGGDILVDSETFLQNAHPRSVQSDGNSVISFFLQQEVSPSDLLVLEFQASTAEKYVDMTVQCGSFSVTVVVGPTPSQYYIPLSQQKWLDYIYFRQSYDEDDFDPVQLGNVILTNYKDEFPVSQLRTGQYELGEFRSVSISADDALLEAGDALLTSYPYLFHLNDGNLSIYSAEDQSLISSVSGLGETRDMCFTRDKQAIVITSRGSGAYIVSVADVQNPYIASHYDTLELCTGLDVDGDFAYIANRYFGVEIVDIRDITQPRYVTRVQAESYSEYQDCYVENGVLYVGIYADKRVDVYDVHDFSNIQLLSSIDLYACGQGLKVKDGILYAATGLFQGDTSHASTISEYGKGAGNGLEIYDVSNPANPQFLSKVSLDGRMFSYSGIDDWGVELCGNYALVTGMGCGLYVYDISDPAKPVRKMVYNIVADTASSKYTAVYHIDQTNPAVYPYDTSVERHGWVTDVAVENGRVYVITFDMGIYLISDEIFVTPSGKTPWTPTGLQESKWSLPEIPGYQVSRMPVDGSVWAVCEVSDTMMALAAGEAGIQLINKSLQPIALLDTQYSVRDIRYQNGYLYTAESEGGLGIYALDESGNIQPVSHCTETFYNSCFSSIALTPDGNFVIAQTANNRYTIINVANKAEPVIIENPTQDSVGNLYYRNVSTGLVAGKYIGVSGMSGINWFYSENGELKYLEDQSGTVGLESQGLTAAGQNCILISSNGYRYWDPEIGAASENIVIDPDYFNGKCTAAADMLVVSRNYDGRICIVDITDIDAPQVEMQMDLDCAVDIVCITDDSIWIPCRYNGVLKLEKGK